MKYIYIVIHKIAEAKLTRGPFLLLSHCDLMESLKAMQVASETIFLKTVFKIFSKTLFHLLIFQSL